MAVNDEDLRLTPLEISRACDSASDQANYPPILTVDQAANLLQVPKGTIYDWHSRGMLKGCCRRLGKHLRFFRDRLLLLVFNQGLNQ